MKTTCFNAHLIQVFYSSFEHCQTSRTCLPSPNLWCALLLCPGEPLLIGPVINTIRGNINNLITMERNYLSQKDWAQDRVWSAEARGGPSLYAVPIKIAGLCPRHSDSFIITEQQHRVHTFRYELLFEYQAWKWCKMVLQVIWRFADPCSTLRLLVWPCKVGTYVCIYATCVYKYGGRRHLVVS